MAAQNRSAAVVCAELEQALRALPAARDQGANALTLAIANAGLLVDELCEARERERRASC